jgi:hypothetical protein
MANLFDIETKLVSLNPNDEENKHLLNKKAWIENDEETGNPVIVITCLNMKMINIMLLLLM